MPKHDFLLSYELEAVFDSFTDEQAGRLIKAVFDYEKRKELPEFGDPLLQMMFDTVIKQKSDDNAKAYILRCEQQRKNIQKRWTKAKNNTMVYNGKNGIPKIPLYTNDTKHTDIDIDIDKSISIDAEAQKLTKEFFELLGESKLSMSKRMELFRKYKEARKSRSKEDVDRELLDYLSQR